MKTRLDTGAKKDLNLFNNVYAGIIPALLGGVPAAAVFFGTKDLFRNIFRYVRTFIDSVQLCMQYKILIYFRLICCSTQYAAVNRFTSTESQSEIE